MLSNTLKLSVVLRDIQKYHWDDDLYIQGEYPWNSDSMCLIINSSDNHSKQGDILLEYQRQYNFKYALSIQIVQDIVVNVKQQVNNVSGLELVKALNFYYKNDAFIKLI